MHCGALHLGSFWAAISTKLVFVQLLVGAALCADGQGFVNLNFENATVVPTEDTYGFLDWRLAAPGWGHSAGGDTSIIYYGSEHCGCGQYYLLMDSTSPVYAPGAQLEGTYSLAFASGLQSESDMNSPWVNAFISQTGLIPVDTLSLRMLAAGPFRVSIGKTTVPMLHLGGNSYGGDISSFAGTIAEVKIMNTATTFHSPTVVDSIAFSPVAVPEPSSTVLLLMGISLFIRGRGPDSTKLRSKMQSPGTAGMPRSKREI